MNTLQQKLEELKAYINMFYPGEIEGFEIFKEMAVLNTYPKNTILLKPGEIVDNLYFITSGIIRYYIPRATGNDLTFGFSFDNEFAGAYDAFVTRNPSRYGLETQKKTEVISITYNQLQILYDSTTIGNKIGRLLSEDTVVKKFDRELSLLEFTPEEYYKKLHTKRPNILKHIPLKYVASYIGITPQSLSRIRKRLL